MFDVKHQASQTSQMPGSRASPCRSSGERAGARFERLVGSAFDFKQRRSDFPQPVTWNFNFPFAPTTAAVKEYASGFERNDGVNDGVFSFNSRMEWPAVEQPDGADGTLLKQGHVTLTRIDIREFGQDTDW